MTDPKELYAMRVSVFEMEEGVYSFGARLETPMKTGEVWEMLCGALVVVYRTVLEKEGMTRSDFLDGTLDLIEKLQRDAEKKVQTVQ